MQHTKLYDRKAPINIVETAFNLLYLLSVTTAGIVLLFSGGFIGQALGACALLLAVGDAFHLLPRIAAMWSRNDYSAALGRGKQIASVTMTFFYLGLWFVGGKYYGFDFAFGGFAVVVAMLAAVRTVLCFVPSNQWNTGAEAYRWSIYRNIPFVLLGTAVTVLFAVGAYLQGGALSWVWLMMVLSFAFYIPVVLFAAKRPMLGMLMLPKSCAYAAIVLMFLAA